MAQRISFVELLNRQKPVTIEEVTDRFMQTLGEGFPEADTLSVVTPPLLASLLGDRNLVGCSGYDMETLPLAESTDTEHITHVLYEYLGLLGYSPETSEDIITRLVSAATSWMSDPENVNLLAAAVENGKNRTITL